MEDRHRFRVYDKEYREYLQGPFDKTICAEDGTGFTVFAYKSNHLGPRGIATLFEVMAMPDRFSVEQCTGIKDRTGKFIYEGDLVRFYYSMADAYYTGVVTFDDNETSASGYYIKAAGRECIESYLDGAYCEIIGNSHDLKGEQKNEKH